MTSVWVFDRYWWQCGLKRKSHWWDRRFEFRWGHGYWSLVFVVCCTSSGHCDELSARSEESNCACVCVCVCVRARNCVSSRNLKNGGLGPSWAVAPQKKNGNLNYLLEVSVQEFVCIYWENPRTWVRQTVGGYRLYGYPEQTYTVQGLRLQ
jgi:hypothetical protein